MLRASYTVDKVIPDSSKALATVFIVDNDIGMSITNDAENVVDDVLKKYPGHIIIYRDTMGEWAELVHFDGKFTGFAPYQSQI